MYTNLAKTPRLAFAMKICGMFLANWYEIRLVVFMLLSAGSIWIQPAQAQEGGNQCGSIANHYGPFDYRTQRDKLEIVERRHFTPEIASLIQITGDSYLGADIAYTLHTSPNHHRALIALVKLGDRMQAAQPKGLRRPVECYFDRAIRFVPDDTVVRLLYAQFLGKQKRAAEAVAQLETAIVHAKDNPLSHYNIGLVFFDFGHYDKALVQAHKALALGLQRTELSDQLKGINQWQEPKN